MFDVSQITFFFILGSYFGSLCLKNYFYANLQQNEFIRSQFLLINVV